MWLCPHDLGNERPHSLQYTSEYLVPNCAALASYTIRPVPWHWGHGVRDVEEELLERVEELVDEDEVVVVGM